HVAVVEIGQDGGEVAGSFERGPAGDAQRDPELGGGDAGQRRLPGSGRSREEQMVGRLPSLARRRGEDLEVLRQALLPREPFPTPGTKVSASRSSSTSARRSTPGECTDKIASASLGPTPFAPMSTSNVSRSSRVGNPNSTMESSRTWRCVNSMAAAPGSSVAI